MFEFIFNNTFKMVGRPAVSFHLLQNYLKSCIFLPMIFFLFVDELNRLLLQQRQRANKAKVNISLHCYSKHGTQRACVRIIIRSLVETDSSFMECLAIITDLKQMQISFSCFSSSSSPVTWSLIFCSRTQNFGSRTQNFDWEWLNVDHQESVDVP